MLDFLNNLLHKDDVHASIILGTIIPLTIFQSDESSSIWPTWSNSFYTENVSNVVWNCQLLHFFKGGVLSRKYMCM